MRAHRPSHLLRAALVIGVGATACLDFPREDRIEDTRILAITTTPAEILYSPLLGLLKPEDRVSVPLPTFDVEVDVFAYDPRGGRVTTTTQFCPEGVRVRGTGDPTCNRVDPNVFVTAEPEAVRDEVAAVYLPRTTTTDIDLTQTPAGRVPGTGQSYAFTPAVLDSIIANDDDGNPQLNFFPLTPRFVAKVVNEDQGDVSSERAFKRLPLSPDLASPDLPADFRDAVADGLGIRLCDAPVPPDDVEFIEGDAECLFSRGANVNPDLVGFDVVEDGEVLTDVYTFADTAMVGRESILRADRGAVLAIEPVFRAGTVERYQVIGFDVELSKILLLNRVEDIALSWFSTGGEVSNGLTAVQQSHTLGVTWALPTDTRESGDRDTLVVVVQDQRGGTTVGTITVVYR